MDVNKDGKRNRDDIAGQIDLTESMESSVPKKKPRLCGNCRKSGHTMSNFFTLVNRPETNL